MKARRKTQRNPHSGSTFDSFLEKEGIREEVEAVAIKRVLAWQLQQEMKKQQKTKQEMARELQTSRSQLDRLLDPRNTAVSLETITRAARVLGKTVVLRIASPRTSGRRVSGSRELGKILPSFYPVKGLQKGRTVKLGVSRCSEMAAVDAIVVCFQSTPNFPSWTSRVRSPVSRSLVCQ
jgi:antitoxin HicB